MAKKITTLTPDQKAKFPEYVEEWKGYGLSMNTLTQELITNLRHNSKVRDGFDIGIWIRPHGCSTVGCIAGWTVQLAGCARPARDMEIPDIAQDLLDLPDPIAKHLFVPCSWLGNLGDDCFRLAYEPLWHEHPNWRCDLDTIAKMKEWARRWDSINISPHITPDIAAHALEGCTRDHPGYVDWQEAFERAVEKV